MAPPLYVDLGKQTRDLFSKGYNFGFLKVDTTSKSGDIEFKSYGDHNLTSSKLFGGVDVKYKIPDFDCTLTQKWNTDNTLTTECVFDERFAKGLKVGFEASITPDIGKRFGKIKAEYRHDSATVNADLCFDNAGGPIINTGAVFQHEPWLLGYYSGFDVSRSKLIRSNVALGYVDSNFTFHSFLNDNVEFGGTAYHRVNDDVELGASVGWTTGEQATRFAIATKYQVDKNTLVRAKIGNNSLLALAATYKLKDGLKATISTQLNLATFNTGGHKVGFGLEIDTSAGKA